MRAAKLLAEGIKPSEVARRVGCTPASVTRWKEVISTRGVEGLKAKPHPGRRPRLSLGQKKNLESILLKGAVANGYRTELWTCRRVAEVIENHFGVTYHPDHVWRLLQGLGWSCQRPQRRARERDERAIATWRKRRWPHIKKRPKKRP